MKKVVTSLGLAAVVLVLSSGAAWSQFCVKWEEGTAAVGRGCCTDYYSYGHIYCDDGTSYAYTDYQGSDCSRCPVVV